MHDPLVASSIASAALWCAQQQLAVLGAASATVEEVLREAWAIPDHASVPDWAAERARALMVADARRIDVTAVAADGEALDRWVRQAAFRAAALHRFAA